MLFGAALLFRRFLRAIKYAAESEGFRAVLGAAITLLAVGTATYSIAEGWSVGDAFYFSVCTLTTSNVADPHLVLKGDPIKIFTAFYVLVGIGVLVETMRQIGLGYVRAQSEHGIVAHVRRRKQDPDP